MHTSDVLRTEAKRLRALADKCDAFAAELEGNAHPAKAAIASNGQTLPEMGEFSGMTQTAAVLKVLERGPKTTQEIYQLLNNNGQSFRKASYVTALLPRLKNKIERTADGKKIKLKDAATK